MVDPRPKNGYFAENVKYRAYEKHCKNNFLPESIPPPPLLGAGAWGAGAGAGAWWAGGGALLAGGGALLAAGAGALEEERPYTVKDNILKRFFVSNERSEVEVYNDSTRTDDLAIVSIKTGG